MPFDIVSSPILNTALNVLIAVVALGLAWFVLRFVLKWAMRIFWVGCISVVVLGALYLAATFFFPGQ